MTRVVATYTYRDAAGYARYQVVRYTPKTFRQCHADESGAVAWTMDGVERVLYRLPELRAARESVVWYCEGEKDADAVAGLGLISTTHVGGSSAWRTEYREELRGRDVVILPDNDEAGAAMAVAILRDLNGVAASVCAVRLPGLAAAGDVSDWIAAGGTVEKLAALAPKAQRFLAADRRLDGERAERVANGKRALRFGVSFLDQALGGIMPSDVVLVGAKTGVGKTALATGVALENCAAGKRVHYFALEAEDREIERRMKFRLISDAYYRGGYGRAPIRFQDWMAGRLENELGQYEGDADEKMSHVTRGLHTFYRLNSFTSDDFRAHLDAIKNETDLVILDHLHYVDSDDADENRGYKRTVKQIRDAALNTGKPIVVVAHVRKGDRRYDTLIPSVEDFHGSSDIPKIATKAIMIAPSYESQGGDSYRWPTYIHIGKNRTDGSTTRHVALAMFDARQSRYEEIYQLGRLTDAGKTFSALTANETPAWCTSARPPQVLQAQTEPDDFDTGIRNTW